MARLLKLADLPKKTNGPDASGGEAKALASAVGPSAVSCQGHRQHRTTALGSMPIDQQTDAKEEGEEKKANPLERSALTSPPSLAAPI